MILFSVIGLVIIFIILTVIMVLLGYRLYEDSEGGHDSVGLFFAGVTIFCIYVIIIYWIVKYIIIWGQPLVQ